MPGAVASKPDPAQDLAQLDNYLGWVVVELGSGVAANGAAQESEFHVALVVVLEGLMSPVVIEEIGFDSEHVLRPEEVDGELPDLDVYLRTREPVFDEEASLPLPFLGGESVKHDPRS